MDKKKKKRKYGRGRGLVVYTAITMAVVAIAFKACTYLPASDAPPSQDSHRPKFIFDFTLEEWDRSREVVAFMQENTPLKNGEKISWCKGDIDCALVAQAVVYEARGEIKKVYGVGSTSNLYSEQYKVLGDNALGLYSVSFVVKNRVEGDNRFPNTVRGVINQPAQFSYIKDMYSQEEPTRMDWSRGYIVAYNTLNDVVDSPIGDATHYHGNHIKPYWSKHLDYVASVGKHIYYKE